MVSASIVAWGQWEWSDTITDRKSRLCDRKYSRLDVSWSILYNLMKPSKVAPQSYENEMREKKDRNFEPGDLNSNPTKKFCPVITAVCLTGHEKPRISQINFNELQKSLNESKCDYKKVWNETNPVLLRRPGESQHGLHKFHQSQGV